MKKTIFIFLACLLLASFTWAGTVYHDAGGASVGFDDSGNYSPTGTWDWSGATVTWPFYSAGSDGNYGYSLNNNTSTFVPVSPYTHGYTFIGGYPYAYFGSANIKLAYTIASGTVELNTTTVANSGVIASASHQLLATHQTATGALAASDGVDWYFVGSPVAKTGFTPSANGMLTLIPYVDTDGYIQIDVINNTSASITLNTAGNGATIKWVVRR
jgi:hypothetical protein